MAFSLPLQAADRGMVHHVDTRDYCLRSWDVSVKMSELQDLDREQKQALVEKTSAYAIYKWETVYEKWGEPVSGYGDFSSVNWDQAGSYTVTVRMPALTEDVVSEVSYTLIIIDDLPAGPETEPEPPAPSMYRITVCYLDEETGEALKDDFVSDEIEEGTVPEIGEELLAPPEGYTVAEILGDLKGEMISDREILVICRKQESGPQEPAGPEDPEGGHTDPNGEPEGQGGEEPEASTGNGGGNSEASGGNGSDSNSNGSSGHNSGKNTGKTSGKNTGNKSEKSSGKGSSGKKNSTGSLAGSTGAEQAAQTVSGTPQTVQTPLRDPAPAMEQQDGQISSAEVTGPEPEEPFLAAGEAEIPDAEDPGGKKVPDQAPPEAAASTALAGGEQEGDQAALGGAVIAQAEARKERYPLWSLTLSTAEGGILAVLGYMVFSDLRLILWFEKKKKR